MVCISECILSKRFSVGVFIMQGKELEAVQANSTTPIFSSCNMTASNLTASQSSNCTSGNNITMPSGLLSKKYLCWETMVGQVRKNGFFLTWLQLV